MLTEPANRLLGICPNRSQRPGRKRPEPGFPFSKWTTNLIKCTKSPYGRGLRCDQGGVEADWRWVRRKISPFSSLSIAR